VIQALDGNIDIPIAGEYHPQITGSYQEKFKDIGLHA
jgi:hypothetical protein